MPPANPATTIPFDLWLWNDDDPESPTCHSLFAGMRERLEAKRHYKRPVTALLDDDDTADEALAFLAWRAAVHHRVVDDDQTFEQFCDRVVAVDPEGAEEQIAAARAELADQRAEPDPAAEGEQEEVGAGRGRG